MNVDVIINNRRVIEVTVNRGSITLQGSQMKSGTTEELLTGQHKILFSTFGFTDFDSDDYNLVLNVRDTSGNNSDYTFISQEADGFTLLLDFNSIVIFNATA